MAKVVFGPIVAEARNKQGNTVFCRNHYGAFTRAWRATPNPDTSPQTHWRDILIMLSQRWSSTLTDDQRRAWRELARATPRTDVFGAATRLTGHGLYIALNANLSNAGVTLLDDTPPKLSVLPVVITALDLQVTASHMYIHFTPSPIPTNQQVVFSLTQTFNAGRVSFGHRYHNITRKTSGNTSPVDVFTPYNAKWPGPAANKSVGVRIHSFHELYGVMSPWSHESAITY